MWVSNGSGDLDLAGGETGRQRRRTRPQGNGAGPVRAEQGLTLRRLTSVALAGILWISPLREVIDIQCRCEARNVSRLFTTWHSVSLGRSDTELSRHHISV